MISYKADEHGKDYSNTVQCKQPPEHSTQPYLSPFDFVDKVKEVNASRPVLEDIMKERLGEATLRKEYAGFEIPPERKHAVLVLGMCFPSPSPLLSC